MSEDSRSGPGLASFSGVDHAVPSVVAFHVVDPSFAAGSPFHVFAERALSFDGLPGLPCPALAGITALREAEVVELVVDLVRGPFALAPSLGPHRYKRYTPVPRIGTDPYYCHRPGCSRPPIRWLPKPTLQ